MKIKRIIEIDETLYQGIIKEQYSLRTVVRNQATIANIIADSTPYNPSGDCISRKDLRKQVVDVRSWYTPISSGGTEHSEGAIGMADEIIELIDNAPPFERPKGAWVRLPNMPKRSYQRMCTNCYNTSYFCGDGDYPTCPYCLADMKKGGKEE